MRDVVRGVVCSLVLLLPVSSLAASTLTVDGQPAAVVVMGSTVTVAVTGAPGQPVTLLADVLPGPTPALGQTLPLGFSPFVTVLPVGQVPTGGTLTLALPVPLLPGVDSQIIYLLAAVHDPAFPFGLDFSNGAALTLVAPPDAGSAQATVVGRKVVLDGSAVAGPDGGLLPGSSIHWVLTQVPAGSQAGLADATRPFATLTPDVAGDYVVRAQIVTPLGAFHPVTVVHAWRVTTSPFADGAATQIPSFTLTGSVAGPPVAAVTVDGQPFVLGPGATLGPVAAGFGPGEAVDEHHLRLTHADGSTADLRLTFFKGLQTPLANAPAKSLAAQLEQGGLNDVATAGEAQLEAADIKGLLLALPPEKVADTQGPFGFTIFSATIDFDDLKYSKDMKLTLDPTTGGLVGKVTIHNVRADFSVWGEVLEIDYNLDGYITTSPVDVHATLVGSASGGMIHVNVTNVVVERKNFDFELTGFIGTVAEAFVIESAVKEDVEETIAGVVQSQLGPATEALLNSFVVAGSLQSVLQVDAAIAAPITGIVHSNHGVTIRLDGKTSVGAAEPGAPAIGHYRGTPTAAVTFGATTPAGAPYEAGLAMADDFLNQLLAAATAAGLLDGDLTSLIPSGGTPISLATDQLAILFPNCGFQHWPVGTPVKLRAHGTVPPTLQTTPGGPGMGRLHLANLEVDFVVETAYGDVPLLLVALGGAADVDLGVTEGMLGATLVGSSIGLRVLRVFPGANAAQIDGQVGFLGAALDIALPQLIQALGAVPLPSLEAAGLGLTPVEIGTFGPANEHVGFFGQLVVVP